MKAYNIDQTEFMSNIVYNDNLKEEDFVHLRKLIAKRKEQRLKMAEAEELERAKQQKEKKSYNFKKTTVSLNSKKPVNFTFTSKGKVLYKKRVDTD